MGKESKMSEPAPPQLHLEKAIKKILSNRSPKRIHDSRFRPSAVLIPIYQSDDGCHIIFNQRTDTVAHHKSQICFPGGLRDEGDVNLEETALREAEEEIGIAPPDVRVLGRLDDITTVTHFVISPFVGMIPHPYPFRVNRTEIAKFIDIPIEAFLDHHDFWEELWTWEGSEYPVYFFRYGDEIIWGATAKIFLQFLELALDWRAPANSLRPGKTAV